MSPFYHIFGATKKSPRNQSKQEIDLQFDYGERRGAQKEVVQFSLLKHKKDPEFPTKRDSQNFTWSFRELEEPFFSETSSATTLVSEGRGGLGRNLVPVFETLNEIPMMGFYSISEEFRLSMLLRWDSLVHGKLGMEKIN